MAEPEDAHPATIITASKTKGVEVFSKVAMAATAVVVIATPAQAARTVSHQTYVALLKQANAKVTKVEMPLERALGSRTATVGDLKRLMLASATVSTQLGHEFAGATPPESRAQEAGRDLSRGELDLGAETHALALRLPPGREAALAYLGWQHPKGGSEVDRALAELRAAGYRTSR